MNKYTIPTLKKLCRKYDMSTKTSGGDNKNKAQLINSLKYKINKTTKNMKGGDGDMEYFKSIGLFQPFSYDKEKLLEGMKKIDEENTITIEEITDTDTIQIKVFKDGVSDYIDLPEINLDEWRKKELISKKNKRIDLGSGSWGTVKLYSNDTVVKKIESININKNGNLKLLKTFKKNIPYLIPFKKKDGENNTIYMPMGIDLKNFLGQLQKLEKYRNITISKLKSIKKNIICIIWNSIQKLAEKGYYYTDLKMENIICIRTGLNKFTIYLADIGSCVPQLDNNNLEFRTTYTQSLNNGYICINLPLDESKKNKIKDEIEDIFYIFVFFVYDLDYSLRLFKWDLDYSLRLFEWDSYCKMDDDLFDKLKEYFDTNYNFTNECNFSDIFPHVNLNTLIEPLYIKKKQKMLINHWNVFKFEISKNTFQSLYLVDFDENTKKITKYTNIPNRPNRPRKKQHRVNIIANGNTYELAFNTEKQKQNVLQKFYNKNLPYNIYIE